MGQINPQQDRSETRKNAGVRKMKKAPLRIDMTPMVDLGFLLITFFVITTELNKPTAMDLAMPKDGTGTELAESAALTILISGDNSLYYYEGNWKDAEREKRILSLSENAIPKLRKAISIKQLQLDNNPVLKEGRNELMLLIKADKSADYKTVVNMLDEAIINRISKYAIVSITVEESEWLKNNID